METPTTCSTPREPTGRCRGDAGAGLVEYALLLALIVVACIGAVTFLGGNLNSNLSRSTSKVTSAGP
jgi:Flp pilus assembly pilin Flp